MTDAAFLAAFLPLVEPVGLPRWAECEKQYVVIHHLGMGWFRRDSGGAVPKITDHEAACIVERALREWLDKKGIAIGPVVREAAGVGFDAVDAYGVPLGGNKFTRPHGSERAALIAAVKAFPKEGK